jgi:nicotinamidase-related amidase
MPEDLLTIPAKPYEFRCSLDKTALLVIDMQGDFCSVGGFGHLLGNDIERTRAIIPAIQSLLQRFRALKLPVIHTREGHKPDLSDLPETKLRRTRAGGAGIGDPGPLGRILIRGEAGHDIIPECYPLPGEPVFDKPGKGSFYQTDLDDYLQKNGIESLIVTGVTTHVCVSTTVKEASDRGYECLVVEDGTAAYSDEDHESALNIIYKHGAIFGWVSGTQDVLESLPLSPVVQEF